HRGSSARPRRSSCIPPPQLKPHFLERVADEARGAVLCEVLLEARLRVPGARELLDDLRGLLAMVIEGLVESALFRDAAETFVGADVLRQLTAHVVREESLCEAGEEVAGDGAELLLGGELGDFAANVIRGRAEQALRATTDERGERLHRGGDA